MTKLERRINEQVEVIRMALAMAMESVKRVKELLEDTRMDTKSVDNNLQELQDSVRRLEV